MPSTGNRVFKYLSPSATLQFKPPQEKTSTVWIHSCFVFHCGSWEWCPEAEPPLRPRAIVRRQLVKLLRKLKWVTYGALWVQARHPPGSKGWTQACLRHWNVGFLLLPAEGISSYERALVISVSLKLCGCSVLFMYAWVRKGKGCFHYDCMLGKLLCQDLAPGKHRALCFPPPFLCLHPQLESGLIWEGAQMIY